MRHFQTFPSPWGVGGGILLLQQVRMGGHILGELHLLQYVDFHNQKTAFTILYY